MLIIINLKKNFDNLIVNWYFGIKVLVVILCKYDGFFLEYKYFGFVFVY